MKVILDIYYGKYKIDSRIITDTGRPKTPRTISIDLKPTILLQTRPCLKPKQ